MGIRPEHRAAEVADVTERAPVVAGRVFAPAGHGEVFPAAVAAARIRHHHVVMAIRQQLHLWYWCAGAADDADRHLLIVGSRADGRKFGMMQLKCTGLGHSLL